MYEGADLQVYLNKMYYGGDTTVTCYGGDNNKTSTCPTNTLDETSKKLIDNHTWNVGAVDDSKKTDTLAFYNAERGTVNSKICIGTTLFNGVYCTDKVIRTTEWTGYIGLLYVTDYAYASSESICETNMYAKVSGVYVCEKNNWMQKNTYIWCLSPRAATSSADGVWLIGGNGIGSATVVYTVFPSIYLKTNVIIESGNGSSSNPYILKLGN